jgi:hypothetical protein
VVLRGGRNREDAVAIPVASDHIRVMRSGQPDEDKISEGGGAPDRGHAAWKRAKVEAALVQAQNREAMIPAAKLLRDLGIER